MSLSFSRRWRVTERATASGVKVRVFSARRDAGKTADMAVRAIEHCEDWFGAYPVRELDIAESDYPLGALNEPGLILISSDVFNDRDALEKRLRFCAAQQIFRTE